LPFPRQSPHTPLVCAIGQGHADNKRSTLVGGGRVFGRKKRVHSDKGTQSAGKGSLDGPPVGIFVISIRSADGVATMARRIRNRDREVGLKDTIEQPNSRSILRERRVERPGGRLKAGGGPHLGRIAHFIVYAALAIAISCHKSVHRVADFA
jgi:hypothetical protein